jgi:hypothetical protein
MDGFSGQMSVPAVEQECPDFTVLVDKFTVDEACIEFVGVWVGVVFTS